MAHRATRKHENKHWLLAFCYLPKANSKKETLLPPNKRLFSGETLMVLWATKKYENVIWAGGFPLNPPAFK